MTITVKNYDSGNQPSGKTWSTEELREQFEVIGFAAPFVVVRRRSDGMHGSMEFTHNPRVYHSFVPSTT